MNIISTFAVAAAAAALSSAAAQAGSVDVKLSGVRSGGKLYVSLQLRDQFMTLSSPYAQMLDVPSAGAVAVRFADVKAGEYALSVWHDDNGNGQFDVNPTNGRPLDGWAMVNAGSLRGRPQFDQVKTSIGADGATLELALHYGR